MLRAVLVRLGTWHHGRPSFGHACSGPSRDVLTNVFAGSAPQTSASQLWRSNPPLRVGIVAWPMRSETASSRIAAGALASKHSTMPPWRNYPTRCPTSSYFAFCPYQRQISKPRRLRPFGPTVVVVSCKVLSAIGVQRLTQAPVTTRQICLFAAHTVGQRPFRPRKDGVCIPKVSLSMFGGSGNRRDLTAAGLEGKAVRKMVRWRALGVGGSA